MLVQDTRQAHCQANNLPTLRMLRGGGVIYVRGEGDVLVTDVVKCNSDSGEELAAFHYILCFSSAFALHSIPFHCIAIPPGPWVCHL